jgi:tetratricopeptide (TPR) repeat protein
MKKLYIVAMLGVAFGFTACEEKLDIPQKASLTTETFYQTDDDAEQALAAAYEGLQVNTVGRVQDGPGIYTPARVLSCEPGDDVNYGSEFYGDHEWGGSINEFRFLHTPEAIYHHYRGLYLSIYPDNLVIEYFGNKEGASEYQKQAVAEARVLRAYNYFLLATYWGTPPFVDHLLDASVVPVKSDDPAAPEGSPKTQQEYYVWIGDECMKAVEDLKERESTTDKEGAYRVTKGFALAMAGKAYMYAGDFAKAKDCLKKVIDSGKYALVPGEEFMDQFHIQGDGSPEKVFEVNFRYNAAAGEWSDGSGYGWNVHSTWMEPNSMQIRSDKFVKQCLNKYTGQVTGWGSIGVPEWYGEAFALNDNGHQDPMGEKGEYQSYRFKATLVHIDDLIYGETGIESIDTYYGKMPAKHADRVKSKNIGIKSGRKGHYGQSFFIPIKHVIREGDAAEGENSWSTVHRLNNIIIMRYAEVLLNYAECCLRTGDAGEAKKYVNMIQERAGSKTISDNVDLITLKKEKSFEMWFEGCRYQDIMRWSKLDNDSYDKECIARLSEQGMHIPHLCDKVQEKPSSIEGIDLNDVRWEHGTEANSRFFIFHTHEAYDKGYEVGWKEKHRLFPYPQEIKLMNPNLKQAGWDY